MNPSNEDKVTSQDPKEDRIAQEGFNLLFLR